MATSFVALDDPVHRLLRELTARTPLVPESGADGFPKVSYRVIAGNLPEQYFSLAAFHAQQGLPPAQAMTPRWRVHPSRKPDLPAEAGFFDAVRLDRRCCRDLRLKLDPFGPGMVAAELLAFGTGMLRACNDNPDERIHRYLWGAHGQLHSPAERLYARIRTLHRNSLFFPAQVQKESFASTNVIYGDAFGELEQLWERRADTAFLGHVASSLWNLRRRGVVAGFLHPPLQPAAVMRLHLAAQARWPLPPRTAKALLHRLEYIREHTILEPNPHVCFRTVTPSNRVLPPPRPPQGRHRLSDSSGSDEN